MIVFLIYNEVWRIHHIWTQVFIRELRKRVWDIFVRNVEEILVAKVLGTNYCVICSVASRDIPPSSLTSSYDFQSVPRLFSCSRTSCQYEHWDKQLMCFFKFFLSLLDKRAKRAILSYLGITSVWVSVTVVATKHLVHRFRGATSKSLKQFQNGG